MSKVMEQVRQDLPHLSGPVPGPRARAIIERDANVVSPSYTRCYPLVAERGEGAIVEDVDGNRFLDFNAGIAVVATGHCHPRVVEAIQKQAARLIHMSGTDFYYEEMVALAEKLAEIAPGRCSAPRLVRQLRRGGHRRLRSSWRAGPPVATRSSPFSAAFTAAPWERSRSPRARPCSARASVRCCPAWSTRRIPTATAARSASTGDTARWSASNIIEDTLLKTIAPAEETAAIVVEPVQGEGGYVVPPQKFFDELARLARQNGILLVFDEVQSGMGRTGKMWASEHFDVVPDILAVAKGIASGMPLGATVARADLMTWPPGAHASTFGGNPVACAAALATIALLEEEPGGERRAHGRAPDGPDARLAVALPHVGRGARSGPDDRHRTGARSGDTREGPGACAIA